MNESNHIQDQKALQEIKNSLSKATHWIYILWDLYRQNGERTLFGILDQSWDNIRQAEAILKKLMPEDK